MPRYGPRRDPDGTQHAPVATVGDYGVLTTLWRRRVGTGGTITCELLRNHLGAGRRLVRLIAEVNGDVHVVMVGDTEEEARACRRLEEKIKAAELHDAQASVLEP
jgi:hypothetical protein